MLTHLTLQNFLLAKRLHLDFGAGFSVVTGPSGSGKSTLFKALTVVLGEKAHPTWVGPHGAEAQVTASFITSDAVQAFLASHDVPAAAGEEVLIRRVWSADGRSRAHVNDTPVSQKLLRALGGQLLDIHGQFDRLLDAAQHRDLLDQYGAHGPLLEQVTASFDVLRAAEKKLSLAEEATASKGERQAFLEYALAELTTLAPAKGEEAALAQEKQFLLMREQVAGRLGELDDVLGAEEGGVLRRLYQAQRVLAPLGDADASFKELVALLENALGDLEELASRLEIISARVEEPDRSLDAVDSRLYALRQAAKRHQITPDELPDLMAQLLTEKEQLDSGEGHIAGLQAAVRGALQAYQNDATQLTDARRVAAKRLDAAVQEMLLTLHLPRARFETMLMPAPIPTASGSDHILFHVALNAGADFTPLPETASGGEQARIILALRAILAAEMGRTTVVFDEADSGMGGAVASSVGERLKELGRLGQVIAITHSPQVAAYAAHHFVMEKHQEATNAWIDVHTVEGTARQDELARMLSGATLTETARAAAGTLLSEAQ